ncbi:hypothetical protein B0H19DRAFT_938713 [Mycena capillaripes]|nr:hypothetical protein B0H19DRAFT_938713 [Mycena capillaripes]
MPRDTFPRGPAYMCHVLTELKDTRPDLFREELRVSPATFDKLFERILGDDVFTNDSRNAQMPVEDQLAITLFRFGHSGNAAGLQKVANWAGVGKGTVTLATRRVMTAILRKDFMAEAVRMPTTATNSRAKTVLGFVGPHKLLLRCGGGRDGVLVLWIISKQHETELPLCGDLGLAAAFGSGRVWPERRV